MLDFTKFDSPTTKFHHNLMKGDVVETSNGKLFAFDRFPRGNQNWYGKSMTDSKSYRIRIPLGLIGAEFKVIGRYSFVTKPTVQVKSAQNDVNSLVKDDLFVIKHGRGNNAELFRYIRSTAKNVKAVNPVTNKPYNISKSFVFTKIANLPY
jgi:hypothetical protein